MLDVAYICFICTFSLAQRSKLRSYDSVQSPRVCISNVKDTIRLCFLQVADVTGS